jgi:hypothetical protein
MDDKERLTGWGSRLINLHDDRVAADDWVEADDQTRVTPLTQERCPMCGRVSPVWRHKVPLFGPLLNHCPECTQRGAWGHWVVVDESPDRWH